MGLFTLAHRMSLPRPVYNASNTMIISHDQFRIVVFVLMCMSVAVAEIVRSGFNGWYLFIKSLPKMFKILSSICMHACVYVFVSAVVCIGNGLTQSNKTDTIDKNMRKQKQWAPKIYIFFVYQTRNLCPLYGRRCFPFFKSVLFHLTARTIYRQCAAVDREKWDI